LSDGDYSKTSTVTGTYLGTRGDMGNQMFQLACIISAAKRSHANIVLPTRITSLPINDLFDLSMFEVRDIVPDASYYEYDNYEDIIVPDDGKNYDIRGYRQAYKYFEDNADDIRRIFTPKHDILNKVRDIVPSRYISIHIRKGDYVKFMHKIPLLREFRRCQLDYYKSGIKKLREFHPNCPLLVCTDSPEWVSPLLSELDNNAMLAPATPDITPKFTDFCTLYLADAVVMSNSTYSWMASYLNPDRTIICPSPWWDPDGFVGTAMGLNGPYLHHPDWVILDADTGELIRGPNGKDKIDTNSDTLALYKLIRGTLL
jgi:hypothetical protein